MSLTSFTSLPHVRERFDETYPNQGNRPQSEMVAPPQTTNYALIGTAFDYLLRFYLEIEVDEVRASPWVAEVARDVATDYYPDRVDEVNAVLNRARSNLDTYHKTGTISRNLLEASLDLARIDRIYRDGTVPEDLGRYAEGDIIDLIQLIHTATDADVFAGESAVLNPEFGWASQLMAGADADVILDGALIDVKVTKIPTFKADYWRQLVGYLVCADIHASLSESGYYTERGFDQSVNTPFQSLPEVTTFGVFFARHGEFISYPASLVYDHPDYETFRAWILDEAAGDAQRAEVLGLDAVREAL
ncbi:hypothetical protein [Haladaptatus sp. YSMS36]|uniref:hypothetical protein n=1 Tax=Haladaptatus sp. YSMS36 TaxID=3033384 RepID=UPI0023E8938A|nr:hypothetical protein [Haladaptatus sp. YSMS36]